MNAAECHEHTWTERLGSLAIALMLLTALPADAQQARKVSRIGLLSSASSAAGACTAPGSLDSRDATHRAVEGDTDIAPPLLRIDPGANAALDPRGDPACGGHAALRGAAARACAGVRWPRRSISHAWL